MLRTTVLGYAVQPDARAMPLTYVAGYDGSTTSLAAVRFAVELGRAGGAQVIAVHAYPFVGPAHEPEALPEVDRQLQDDVRAAGRVVLDALDADGVGRTMLVCGAPAHALHDLAVEHEAALISVGATRRGRLGRLVPGSTAAKLLHGAPCAVVTVPEGAETGPIRSIGVAYDGREQSRHALAAARRLASGLGARLVLLGAYDLPMFAGPALSTSWDIDPAKRDAFARRLQEAAAGIPDMEVETRVLIGSADEILAAADDVDLLVTGSRGYGPVRSVLLGGVSRRLVDNAPCPVLVVPRSADAQHAPGAGLTPNADARSVRAAPDPARGRP
jgi:nucleotide-binding universal stress UspA family protein